MQVVALCEALYEDTSITNLDLSYNNLNDMAAQALARLIKVCINVATATITTATTTRMTRIIRMYNRYGAGMYGANTF